MARYEFKLPDIGEGVTEGEIVEWLVKPGDDVNEDQAMVEVMTDKATVTITSPKKGKIVETVGAKGQVVKVHAVLVVYELGGGTGAVTPAPLAHAPAAPAPLATKSDGPAATAVGDIKESLPGMGGYVATATAGIAKQAASEGNVRSLEAFRETHAPVDEYTAPNGRALATPATRKLARDLGVDLTRVRPSGDTGRVTKDDVRGHVARQQHAGRVAPTSGGAQLAYDDRGVQAAPPPSATPTVVPTAAPAAATRAPVAISTPAGAKGEALEQRVPFRGLRRKIAEKMHVSTSTVSHFTFVEEVDCTALKVLRERLKPKAESMGVKLSYLPFITKAVVASLKKHPTLNSALDETTDELVIRKYFNIGIATATDAGLVVPVVKNADRRSLLDISREIDRVSSNARAGKSQIEDLQGSTFTITSLGQQGGLFATPIVNFPEVAILGVHQMKQKPVVRDGAI
ncbi:MAG: dihydrolipoamide acetyltransferase family protein, partial [Deltaproteobacteria bacterium]